MKKSKQILAALLCAVMVLAFVPAISVLAEEYSGTCGTNLTWTLDTDTGILTISGTGPMTDYTIELFTAPWHRYQRSITSVVIENGVTNIGIAAFAYCESLTTVNIPNSVTSIGRHAFYDCTSLESINIPDGVISIGEYAFWWCTSLKSITIPKSITNISQTAFNICTDLTEIIVDEANSSYCSVDGVLFSKDKTKLVICPEGNEGAYSIPDGATSIGDLAFYYCISLTSIIIPDSVTSIGEGAFNYCTSLTSITIPDSVTSIGDAAFCVCTSLASISIPNSVTSIGEAVFESCESLESIAIPNSVTNIGDYAFEDCISLESIAIPNSVTSIGYYAFGWCDALTDVYYSGSEADWTNISIDDGNEYLTDATIHYNCVAMPTEVTLPAVGAYENAAEAEVIIDEDGEVTINLTITDKSALSASNVTAYAVSYSSGAAETIVELSKTITAGGATFSGSVSGAYKIFIWDENMQPITEAAE